MQVIAVNVIFSGFNTILAVFVTHWLGSQIWWLWGLVVFVLSVIELAAVQISSVISRYQ